ncbi:tetratricopeptide repeat protein [Kordiimonas aestuarii]|uniref:tetratricopeptide repeat protein n=1 Tax=Kordiimonas aestuarii TaxID=1005925 RepID=UPI0021CF4A66|nr:tetratricopeptide repeat protein [Kordiimonas aestuarii]
MTATTSAYIQQAASQLQQGLLEPAEKLLNQLNMSTPGHPDVLHLLAMAAKQRGDHTRAEYYFRESLKAAPHQAAVYANLANMLSDIDRADDAVLSYKKAVEIEPAFATGWHNLALILSDVGDHDGALAAARKFEALAGQTAQTAELFASVHQHAGEMKAAKKALEGALKREPNNARLWNVLGALLRRSAEFTDAAEAYEKARSLGLRDPDMFQNLAEAYYENADITKAVTVLDDAVKAVPDSGALHYVRAKFCWEAMPGEDHLAALKQAIPKQASNISLWGAYFDLLSHEGRFEDILKGLSEAYRFNIHAPRLSLAEAVALSRTEKVEEATAVFEELLRADPDSAPPKLNYAAHLMKAGDPEKAEKLCADILANDPGNQKAWTFRGTAWQLMGDERAHWLFDFERMVNPIDVAAPDGYESRAAFFNAAQQELDALHRMQSHPLDQTLRGGTQTNGFLFRLKNPVVQELYAQIKKAVKEVISGFPDDPAHPFWGRRGEGFDFSGAWSVRLKSQGYHTNHFHPEGWLSSALYIALPEEVKAGSGTAGHIQFGVPTMEMGIELAPGRIVKPEVGRLVLFPSYMWHGTIPFSSNEPRMTVAFDVVPKP